MFGFVDDAGEFVSNLPDRTHRVEIVGWVDVDVTQIVERLLGERLDEGMVRGACP